MQAMKETIRDRVLLVGMATLVVFCTLMVGYASDVLGLGGVGLLLAIETVFVFGGALSYCRTSWPKWHTRARERTAILGTFFILLAGHVVLIALVFQRLRFEWGMWISLDGVKVRERLIAMDQIARQHLINIGEILAVTPFYLRERLGVQIEMMERRSPLTRDERTSVLPSRLHRNEVVGRSQLQIHRQLFLQLGQSAIQPIAIWDNLQIHIDRACAPSEKHCGDAAREVDPCVAVSRITQRAHQLPDACGIN